MFISRISIYGESVLFDAVLIELPDLCDSFVCYPSEKVFIVQSSKHSAQDLEDMLRWRYIKTDHVVIRML